MTNPVSSCDFCSDEIGVATFVETPLFRAAYNLAPIVPGHSLVIPKKHIQSVNGLTDEEFGKYWQFAREVTNFLLEVFETNAFDWTVQEMPEAGQTVPHLHLHVIPRVADDFPNAGDWYPRLRESRIVDHAKEVIDSNDRVKLSVSERGQIAEELRRKWSATNRE